MPPTSKTRVRDLFQIPEQIGRMDFTVALADGISRADETVKTYVLTPQIVQSFREALGLIDQAQHKCQSQATYLHGSFGSGKSHFMAILSLLLADHEGAWRRPELHALRVDFPWIGEATILELHVHMLNQPNVETPIFRAYLNHVREHHPEADLPALFADERLFEDAQSLLTRLGEEKFFAPMNEAKAKAKATAKAKTSSRRERMGKTKARSHTGIWDRARFDAARQSFKVEERAKLLTALTKTHFTSYVDSSPFIDIDRGLGILSRHAKALGYDVIVLLLDELILWLSYMGRDPVRLGQSVQRMVKLVEATDNDRPAPFCSFVARQRALREMVGEELAGPDDAHLGEVLDHARGRFGTISLGDNNLPAIVDKRVLIPRDKSAKDALSATFDRLRSESQHKGSWTTLLGTGHDAKSFRKLYPFSPVLIDALVALSNALQRQRTAIKLLTELLMRHIEDLRLGQLVGIGDLFDVMAEGEKSTEGVLGARFDAARKLYKFDLLPLIQETNGTEHKDRCQRERPEHPPDLGCANCPEKACRNDNRVIKTLLTAALVPGVKAFRDLTARRLVELNHGFLTSKIPGRETAVLVGKLRKWASNIGQLRVDEQNDPLVSIQLEGVDVRPLLEQARSVDTDQRRRKTLYELLFAALDLESKSDELSGDLSQKHEWRGTRRPGTLRFDNVRRLSPEQLRCPEHLDWRLIIDYPFDEAGFGPHDDERVLESFLDEGGGTWTLVWLPSFFSAASNRTLGELVKIDHILGTTANFDRFVGHLSVEQQESAKLTLHNLQSQKRQHLRRVLAKAYGLVRDVAEDDADLDPARSVDRHLILLKHGASLGASLPGHLGEAFRVYVTALLDARYPRHPRFRDPLTSPRIERILEHYQAMTEAPDKKINIDGRELKELRGTLCELGLITVTESTAHIRSDGLLQTIESRRLQKGVEHPRADEVLHWADSNEQMGLQADAQAVLVRAYALSESRTLIHDGHPFEVHKHREIPGDVLLELPELPSKQEWLQAIEMAGHTFGVSVPRKALSGDNLRRFSEAVSAKISAQGESALRLPLALVRWRQELHLTEASDRLATAEAASKLIESLQDQSPAEQARVLAGFDAEALQSSPSAIGKSLATSRENLLVLDNPLILGVFNQLLNLQNLDEATLVLQDLQAILRKDELHGALARRVRQLAESGQEILARGRQTPPPPPPLISPPPPPDVSVLITREFETKGRAAILRDLEDLFGELRDALNEQNIDEFELRGHIELRGKRGGDA